MSIVGPRPQLVRDMVFMTDEQRKRHDVRPGLSGLAQVNGRNDIDWEDKLSIAVKSNKESGDGFADILVKPKNPDAGIIMELKYARSFGDLDKACERALEQIKDRRYDQWFHEEGRNDILAYGIAFYKKRCKVVVEKL